MTLKGMIDLTVNIRFITDYNVQIALQIQELSSGV